MYVKLLLLRKILFFSFQWVYDSSSLALAASSFAPRAERDFKHFPVSKDDWEIVEANIFLDITELSPGMSNANYNLVKGMVLFFLSWN